MFTSICPLLSNDNDLLLTNITALVTAQITDEETGAPPNPKAEMVCLVPQVVMWDGWLFSALFL